MLLSASSEIINLKLLEAQQLDFIVVLQMHILRTGSTFKKNNGKKKKKDDEDLLQLKKIYDEGYKFEDPCVAKPRVFLEDIIKKRKLSGRKITNCVIWKLSDMCQLQFDLKVEMACT